MIEVLIARELIPFLDIAYRGFGRGLDEDAYAIRAIASAGLTALVSNSFSKIFHCTASVSAACRWSVTTPMPPGACWAS